MDLLLVNKALVAILDKYNTTISSGFGNVIFTRLMMIYYALLGCAGSCFNLA